MYIPRIAEASLTSTSSSTKILIILGARQVGKTTLIKHFLQAKNTKSVFLNLDIEVDQARLIALANLPPDAALSALGNPQHVVIDEAQRLSATGRIVKGWYDAGVPAKIVLLGSSSLDLLNQFAESLTGRNEKIFLPPLLFKEVVAVEPWYSATFKPEYIYQNFSAPLNSLLIQNIVYGNYPEAVLTSGDKENFLLNLAADYLLKDVLQVGLVKSPEIIRRLLMLLAHQVGAEASVNELARSLGISRQTVEKYLELLEQTFVIFRLPAFSTNPRKEITKSQKIYFWDTGVRNAILKEFSTSPLRPDIGALWENWVVAEAAKQNLLSGKKKNLYFWRSRSQSEVDLVVKDGEKLSAYEIKWRAENGKRTAFESLYDTSVRVISSNRPLVDF